MEEREEKENMDQKERLELMSLDLASDLNITKTCLQSTVFQGVHVKHNI